MAVFISAPIVNADAITGKSNDGLANQTERWLRLRAVAACFDKNDVGKNSYSDVENGKIFDSGGVAIGYLNEDGKVSCDGDGGAAFVRNSFKVIGFSNPVEAFCSVQPMASRGSADTKSQSNFEGCVNGSGNEFDMDSDAFDQGARQVGQFKEGYNKHAKNPISWNPTPSMMYHLYRSSLVEFCGAKLVGKYDPADKNNIDADKRKVVVNDVDLGTGEIIRNVYKLSRDQGDKVDDLYVNSSLHNHSNVTCSTMAQKTWDYDDDMKGYVLAYNTANPDDRGSGVGSSDGTDGNEAVCTAGALGWIFCPLVDFMDTATSMVAGWLEERLVFQPLIGSDAGDAIKSVWGALLSIANAGLIIAFLIIVFSQATSIGLSSYGIKKLLPRVAIAAVLMNLSFYICAIAIDAANILGVSIQSIVEVGINQLGTVDGTNASNGANGFQWAVAVSGLIAGLVVATVSGAIFLLLPVLATAMIAVFTAFLILAARDVLITLLVIVSPLAFLAWILPNTDDWFKKWRKLFTSLLLMFPLVMAIFYGSVLVSNMILITGNGGSDGDAGFMTNLIALAVLTIPLFSLPFIMKSAGNILERVGAVANNPNKGLVDRTRKWSHGQSQRTRDNNMAQLAGAKWGKNQDGIRGRLKRGASGGANFVGGYTSRRDFRRNSLKTDADRIQQNALADQLQDENSSFAARSTLRGETGRAIARARGVSIQDKAIGEEVSAAKTVIENMQFTNAQMSQLATTGSAQNIQGQMLSGDFYQKAAQQQFVATGQSARVHDMLKNSENMSQEVRESLAYHLQQNYSTLKAKDHSLNSDALKESLIKGTKIDSPQLQLAAVQNMSGLTKETLAGQDAKGIEQLRLAIQNGVGKPEQRANALQVVNEMMTDPQLAGKLNVDSEKQFKAILQDQSYSTYQNNINQSNNQPPSNPNPPSAP